MGYINLPNLDEITQIKDPKQQMEMLINTVGILMKSLSELNGYINSKNIFEAGGWRVTNTELVSKNGDVGMSTEDTTADDVRFWAGDVVKETSRWRVTKSGIMYATGGIFRSAANYPLVAVNLDTHLIAAYSAPGTYIAFTPLGTGNVPALSLVSGGTIVGFLNRTVGGTSLGSFGGEPLNLQGSSNIVLNAINGAVNLVPTGSLQINGTNGVSGTFFASSTPAGPADMQITFTKGIRTG